MRGERVSCTWDNLTTAERYNTLRIMEAYGGGFCQQLVRLIQLADSANTERLVHAFDHLIDKYQPKNWSTP